MHHDDPPSRPERPPDPPGEPSRRDEHEVPAIDELYDADTLAAIESWARGRVSGERPPVPGDAPTAVPIEPAGRRDPRSLGTGAAMLAAAMFGLADALEPPRVRPAEVEYAPDLDHRDEPVTFLHVPGDPAASRLIIRPWLLGG